jgi:hypothetical protein
LEVLLSTSSSRGDKLPFDDDDKDDDDDDDDDDELLAAVGSDGGGGGLGRADSITLKLAASLSEEDEDDC